MKSKNSLRLIGLAGLACLFSSVAYADEPGFYGGLSIGVAKGSFDESTILDTELPGLFPDSTSDHNGTAFKLFGGYQFNRNFALEAGYFNLGNVGFTSTVDPVGDLASRFKVSGLNLDAVGTMPLGDRLSVFARAGIAFASTKASFDTTGGLFVLDPTASKSGANLKVGAGFQYALSPSFSLRAEAEHYRVDDAVGGHGGVNVLSVGLVFPFGHAPAPAPAPMQQAMAPEAPPAPPPPAPQSPVVVVVPPPAPAMPAAPAPRRVSFSADSLFSFDKATIRQDGKTALDQFYNEINGTRYRVIRVIGHTDRLGTPAYNQRLSMRRAEAVKAYLVNAGIDPAKISAVGKGESEPVTRRDECRGDKQTPKLIACLQRDRRVDVEVVGVQ